MDVKFLEAAPIGPVASLVAQVPFAKNARAITALLQDLRKSDGLGRQPFALINGMGHTILEFMPASQKSRPRWCTGWTHMKTCEANRLFPESIDPRRADDWIAMTGKIAVTHVIGHHDDDVGTGASGCRY